MRENILSLISELKNQLELEAEALANRQDIQEISGNDLMKIGNVLNEKRKMLRLDLQSLEWQTGISRSTLKRMFKDPSQVKFVSIVRVAEALGIRLCFVK